MDLFLCRGQDSIVSEGFIPNLKQTCYGVVDSLNGKGESNVQKINKNNQKKQDKAIFYGLYFDFKIYIMTLQKKLYYQVIRNQVKITLVT